MNPWGDGDNSGGCNAASTFVRMCNKYAKVFGSQGVVGYDKEGKKIFLLQPIV